MGTLCSKTRCIQCGSGLTADPIGLLLSCYGRGRMRILKIKIRGLMRTQNFGIRASMPARRLLDVCSIV